MTQIHKTVEKRFTITRKTPVRDDEATKNLQLLTNTRKYMCNY